ncbi:response regulator [Sporosarcina sp. FSL K6-1522]|uniref:response regulator n=1 Tax=Sporosarcina sp. FSL K6-1522 TaxID=2921554 RepID=UPI003159C900
MINAVLIDDEELTLQYMTSKLTKLGTINIIKTFTNAQDFLNDMKRLHFDVIFLDIEMPGMNGLELATRIHEWNPAIYIVFVTAHRDYAIQAFDLGSIDYLVKPILTPRLEKTIKRIQTHMQTSAQRALPKQSITPSLKVECFDEFVTYHHDEPVKWKTTKTKELFAFFMTHLHTHVNRDTIIDLLWPGHDYHKAKIQLHTSISYLRKTLDSLDYSQALTFSNQSYALELDDFQCDAIEFEQMMDQHPVVTQQNIQAFEQTVQQYRGGYMERNSYEWATIKAQSIHQKLLQLLQSMIDYFTTHKDLAKKQHYLHMLLTHNPYSDHTLQQLMRHYIEIGNRGDAVKVYKDFSTMLMKDIGISPDQVSQEIYTSIL